MNEPSSPRPAAGRRSARRGTHRSGKARTGRDGRPFRAGGGRADEPLVLYGRHAVRAALVNPRRRPKRLRATRRAIEELRAASLLPPDLPVEECARGDLEARLGPGVAHQGLLLEVEPLPPVALEALDPRGDTGARVAVLDRVEDPMNVGAVLRSAALFGVRGLVTTDRHAPRESGALAKAAAGALEIVPWVRVPNLARALDRLAGMGYWRLGLAARAPRSVLEIERNRPLAIVLGAEGRGLRPLTRRHVDLHAGIPLASPAAPFDGLIDSLNVSVSAGIAFHALFPEG